MQHLPRHLIIPFARAGYAARGLIYLVIGIFAIGAAFWSFEKKDTKGAVLEVLQLPLGMALIIALLIGLAGYVGWRLVQAVFDTDDHGLSPAGAAVRLGLLASAATYATLGIYTLSLIGGVRLRRQFELKRLRPACQCHRQYLGRAGLQPDIRRRSRSALVESLPCKISRSYRGRQQQHRLC